MAKLGPLKRHGDSSLHRHLRRRAERRHETLLVHPPQTQGCPVIPLPFLHPTAWDTQWWAVGVTRERLGVYVTKIQYTTRICNKVQALARCRAGSPFYIHEVIQGRGCFEQSHTRPLSRCIVRFVRLCAVKSAGTPLGPRPRSPTSP